MELRKAMIYSSSSSLPPPFVPIIITEQNSKVLEYSEQKQQHYITLIPSQKHILLFKLPTFGKLLFFYHLISADIFSSSMLFVWLSMSCSWSWRVSVHCDNDFFSWLRVVCSSMLCFSSWIILCLSLFKLCESQSKLNWTDKLICSHRKS